ncbi:MAG: SufS family cysteine desulfurase [Waddliaceae bacterium]
MAVDSFPMKKEGLVYLDSAATTLKPTCVIDAVRDFYSKEYGTVHRAIYDLSMNATTQYDAVRSKVQKFLNAQDSCEIIFTSGTTESINLVAHSFGEAFIQKGDVILVTELEHHSNIVPWQLLCERTGAQIKVIPATEDGELDLNAYAELLTDQVKLVSVAHISNAIGTIHPIEKIIKMAHAMGAKVLIDGAQAAPHLHIDVRALDADFYAFSGHKVYGPTGVGVLYGKRELLEAMPPFMGGGDMIKTVSFSKTTFADLPMKFEAGTPPIAEVIGLGAALDFLERQKPVTLQNLLLDRLSRLDKVKIIGRPANRGPIVSFVVDGLHPLDIGTMLNLKGIAIRTGHHCAQPAMEHFCIQGCARASLGVYNTEDEIEYFTRSLESVIKKLC